MSATAATVVGGPGYCSPKVFLGAANPTVNNDLSTGADVGDLWINTSNKGYLVCTSAASGAAAWNKGGVGTPATIAAITGASGGTAGAIGTISDTATANAVATIQAKVNAIITALQAAGVST